jgi:hypothetical protein
MIKKGMDYLHPAGEIWLDPTSTDWLQCDSRSDALSPLYTESSLCANSIPFKKYSIIAHLSYTTKKAFDVCPYDPMSMNVPVNFLPDYTVSE